MLKPLLTVIKVLAIVLITGALGLELWHQWRWAHGQPFPASLQWLLTGFRVVLVAHAIEGIIAAVSAQNRRQHPLRYGIYTFFVGFPGLMELGASQEELP